MVVDKEQRKREAERFWRKYDIPIEYGVCIKVRRSGLLRGSSGNGRARDTVQHLHVKEAFRDGRLQRAADRYLCEKGSYVREMAREGELEEGLPRKITCETCLKRMERWKLDPSEWSDGRGE